MMLPKQPSSLELKNLTMGGRYFCCQKSKKVGREFMEKLKNKEKSIRTKRRIGLPMRSLSISMKILLK